MWRLSNNFKWNAVSVLIVRQVYNQCRKPFLRFANMTEQRVFGRSSGFASCVFCLYSCPLANSITCKFQLKELIWILAWYKQNWTIKSMNWIRVLSICKYLHKMCLFVLFSFTINVLEQSILSTLSTHILTKNSIEQIDTKDTRTQTQTPESNRARKDNHVHDLNKPELEWTDLKFVYIRFTVETFISMA